jgi:hypothetical protein
MNYKLLLGLCIVLMIPLVFAEDVTVLKIGESTRLWADVTLNELTFYPATGANISIYYPNATLAVNNQSMAQVRTGVFTYNYTPNTTGVHYTYTHFYNGTTLAALATSTFFVQQQDETMYLTLLFGLLSIIFFCFWYARSMSNKPKTAVGFWIFENVTTKDFAIIFDIIGAFLIIPLLALLNIWSMGTTYNPIFANIYMAGTYFIGFSLVAYLTFYLIYRYNDGIEKLGLFAGGKQK